MKTRIVASILCFFLSFTALMAQDFILTEGYAKLNHEFVHERNVLDEIVQKQNAARQKYEFAALCGVRSC